MTDIPADLQAQIDARYDHAEALAVGIARQLNTIADAAAGRGWLDAAKFYRDAAQKALEGEGAAMSRLIDKANELVNRRTSAETR